MTPIRFAREKARHYQHPLMENLLVNLVVVEKFQILLIAVTEIFTQSFFKIQDQTHLLDLIFHGLNVETEQQLTQVQHPMEKMY